MQMLSGLHICTWIFAEDPQNESAYLQMPGSPSSESFQAAYWRAAALFFATSQRHSPDARQLLFTNVERLPTIAGISMKSLLDELHVEVVPLELTFVSPPKHYHAWRNQFYVFDIARYLSRRLSDGESAAVFDADCVWIGPAGPLSEALERDGVLTYVETYPVEWPANGLTRQDMQRLASDLLGRDVPHPLVYCGGEVIAATASEWRRMLPEIEFAWADLIRRHEGGQTTFNEEAQMLSFIYYKLGYPLGNADPFIRRIWTGSLGTFNTALPHDEGLVVWHLPLEKRFGVRRLFPLVADRTSDLWTLPTGPELRRYLGRQLGVPRNSLSKKARDLATRISDKIRHR